MYYNTKVQLQYSYYKFCWSEINSLLESGFPYFPFFHSCLGCVPPFRPHCAEVDKIDSGQDVRFWPQFQAGFSYSSIVPCTSASSWSWLCSKLQAKTVCSVRSVVNTGISIQSRTITRAQLGPTGGLGSGVTLESTGAPLLTLPKGWGPCWVW